MTDFRDVLLGLAETATGVAGFAGVAAAVMLSRSFERDDQFRFLCLFGSALSVVFLAYTPILLELSGLSGNQLWVWSSGVFIAVVAGALPLAIFTARLAVRQSNMAPRWALGPLWFFTLGAPITQVMNLLGWVGGPDSVLFIVGLLSWLGAAGVLFVIIVLVRRDMREPEEGQAD
ncbi:MAG: hypothetical protein AAFN07_12855 [Pseudomonadota bacterium]